MQLLFCLLLRGVVNSMRGRGEEEQEQQRRTNVVVVEPVDEKVDIAAFPDVGGVLGEEVSEDRAAGNDYVAPGNCRRRSRGAVKEKRCLRVVGASRREIDAPFLRIPPVQAWNRSANREM